MADKDKRSSEPEPSATDDVEFGDVAGEYLAEETLPEPGAYVVAPDETEAEELEASDEPAGADPVDDSEQLSGAELVAAAAKSTRPVRKSAVAAAATPKKDHATPKRTQKRAAEVVRRTTPVQFVREAADELRKVVWPTTSQLRQYFVVVLIFVLIVIAYVSALDLFFGWGLLKIFG